MSIFICFFKHQIPLLVFFKYNILRNFIKQTVPSRQMGYRICMNLIPASKYLKLLRPKLIQFYGPVNQLAIIREQERRMKMEDILNDVSKGQFRNIFRSNFAKPKPQIRPLQKFLSSKKSSPFKGDKTDQCEQLIHKIIQKESVYQDGCPNNFLRMDLYLGSIDSFEDLHYDLIKVCNSLNVENFLSYIEFIKAAFNCWEPQESKAPKKRVVQEKHDKLNSSNDGNKDNQDDQRQEQRSIEIKKDEQKHNYKESDEENEDWIRISTEYEGLYWAEKCFGEALKRMKESKKQLYLVFRVSG